MRSWDDEPELPMEEYGRNPLANRLPEDVKAFLDEVWRDAREQLSPYYPIVEGRGPWGYLWATAIVCQECGNRFPLVGSLNLRMPNPKKNDAGQSLFITGDPATGELTIRVDSGLPTCLPTRVVAHGKSKYDSAGKVAVCCFCNHVHSKDVHTRLVAEGKGFDMLLAVADNDDQLQRVFRLPTAVDLAGYERAQKAVAELAPLSPFLSAVPDEPIPHGPVASRRESSAIRRTHR
jgi:putative DNA methylase